MGWNAQPSSPRFARAGAQIAGICRSTMRHRRHVRSGMVNVAAGISAQARWVDAPQQ
jgi:hypothetical protein